MPLRRFFGNQLVVGFVEHDVAVCLEIGQAVKIVVTRTAEQEAEAVVAAQEIVARAPGQAVTARRLFAAFQKLSNPAVTMAFYCSPADLWRGSG